MLEKRIAIVPGKERENRSNLFSVLEQAYPVRFEGRELQDTSDTDGMIHFLPLEDGLEEGNSPSEPTLDILIADPAGGTSPVLAQFAETPLLPRCIRGQQIRTPVREALGIAVHPSETVLSYHDGGALWVGDGRKTRVLAAGLAELSPGHSLLHHIEEDADRLIPFLGLLHFIRGICGEDLWHEPGLRASFLMDDPNLHWPSYGFLDFREAAAHAERHNYHLAIAMVPLDGWVASRGAVDLFRRNERLSILVHGNNHVKRELGRSYSDTDALELLAQALRRINRFESRYDLQVSRIMAAPHGVCSEGIMTGMFRLGFEGLCISRPYPWLGSPPPDRPLAGWRPSELVVGGFPIIPRYKIGRPKEHILLRAFLHHPIVPYGHHTDIASGLDVLREWADFVNGLGDVNWASLESISRSNFARKRVGSTLHIRPYAGRMLIRVPPGVDKLDVEMPFAHGVLSQAPLMRHSNWDGAIPADSCGQIEVAENTALEIVFLHPDSVPPESVPSPGINSWAILRRVLVEGRDRLLPLTTWRAPGDPR